MAASVYYCGKQVTTWRRRDISGFIVGTILAFILTGIDDISSIGTDVERYDVAIPLHFRPKTAQDQEISNYDSSSGILKYISADEVKVLYAQGILTDESIVVRYSDSEPLYLHEVIQKQNRFEWINPWVIFCGALAVCALLLPGISGSYLLQMLGIYSAVIAALADFTSGLVHLSFNFRAALLLANLAVGITLGAALFSHFISYLLSRYRSFTIAFLTGCMVGSLRTLWPFYDYQYVLEPIHLHRGPRLETMDFVFPAWDDPMLWYGIACCIVAFAFVCFVERIAKRSQKTKLCPMPPAELTASCS